MKKGKQTQLTSVKVYTELFTKFKMDCITENYTLNKLVNASIERFREDPEFRENMKNYKMKIENDNIYSK